MATTDDDGALGVEDSPRDSSEGAPTRIAEGDDIVVVPAGPTPPTRRALLAGVAIVAILAIVGAVAILARHNDSKSPVVRTTSPTLAPKPVVKTHPKPTVHVKRSTKPPVVVTTPATASPTTIAARPVSIPVLSTPPPPATNPPVTTAAPLQHFGPSVLTWTAPHSLTIAAGKTAALSVTAHNPTNGVVTLPHPLGCTPRLDGQGVCTEMAQLIQPGQSASAQFTIDAKGIAPGNYTLKIEGVLTVNVTVS